MDCHWDCFDMLDRIRYMVMDKQTRRRRENDFHRCVDRWKQTVVYSEKRCFDIERTAGRRNIITGSHGRQYVWRIVDLASGASTGYG